jgi:predicted nicotinamide N-methyase
MSDTFDDQDTGSKRNDQKLDTEQEPDTTTTSKPGTSKTTEEDANANDISAKQEDDAMYADLGFMFEGSHASTLKHFDYQRTTKGPGTNNNNNNKPIRIALKVVDDEPGGVQSGHYLWPASPALCEYMIQVESKLRPKGIIELGAGCALVSLVALQLYQEYVRQLVVTDHDPGTLERARDNHEETLEELYERAETEEEQFQVINRLGSIPVAFESLEWGQAEGVKKIQKSVVDKNNLEPPLFDLVLGSDLIYCTDVVEPLLTTASMFMNNSNNNKDDGAAAAKFLLSQSFVYDQATEETIDEVCTKLKLERIVHQDKLSEKGARIQEFRFQKVEEEE